MEKRRCAACHKLFHPRPQSPGQKFCSAAACQRERKRRWQKARRAADADYRDNDLQANRQWRRRHPDYWRAYRRKHPRSVIRNRDKQRERDRARRLKPPRPTLAPQLANEDVSKYRVRFQLDSNISITPGKNKEVGWIKRSGSTDPPGYGVLVDPSLRSLIHPTRLPRVIEKLRAAGLGYGFHKEIFEGMAYRRLRLTDDCMDAGGRATYAAVAEKIFLVGARDKRDRCKFVTDSG